MYYDFKTIYTYIDSLLTEEDNWIKTVYSKDSNIINDFKFELIMGDATDKVDTFNEWWKTTEISEDFRKKFIDTILSGH